MSTQEKISSEMRRLLASNRDGKLTSDQWLAAVFEPIVPILLFLTPFIVVLAARSGRVGIVMGLAFGVIGTVWLGLSRMVRYARLPVFYDEMTAASDFRPMRIFGAPAFTRSDGSAFTFKRRYTPKFNLTKEIRYGVYWLHDGNAPVLLSLSPLDHANAASWKPTSVYHVRLERRMARRAKLKKPDSP